MNAENFIYWLNGYLEIHKPEYGIGTKETEIIKDHLKLVLNKITPNHPMQNGGLGGLNIGGGVMNLPLITSPGQYISPHLYCNTNPISLSGTNTVHWPEGSTHAFINTKTALSC
jgi:hypothetical protein